MYYIDILDLRQRVLKLGWGKQPVALWAPTRPTTLDVRTYTYSVRSVPTEQHQQTLLIHDVFLLLVGSTKSSFSSSSTSSRCLCSSRRGELTACVRVGSLEEAAVGKRTIHQSAAAHLLYQAPPARAEIAAE